MECTTYREAISAAMDGEDPGCRHAEVAAHLAGCPACQAWAEVAGSLTRRARVGVADVVPDLTTSIVAGVGFERRPVGSPAVVARLGLLMVAAAQLLLAVPPLLGRDAGASIHVAHEQGSWDLALAVGLLVVVVQPRRAASLLAVMAALAGGLALTMAVDIAAGRTNAAAEAPHGLAFLGLAFLWLLSREVDAAAPRRAPRTAGTGRVRPA
ncbi:MAG TPA: zf-HC2 domain-containing protein [Acidimicrobiales bacterium]|jgi:predicted anti-sigma-YlaC factor YlaD|nr:zf-HC2 domain-containing protein [Acidimicrobiales bacterium]